MEILQQLVAQLATLGGVASLITVIVNALKVFGVVGEDAAPTWSAGFNLIALVVLFGAQIVHFDVSQLDPFAGNFAQLIALVLSLIAQLGLSKVAHWSLRGV